MRAMALPEQDRSAEVYQKEQRRFVSEHLYSYFHFGVSFSREAVVRIAESADLPPLG